MASSGSAAQRPRPPVRAAGGRGTRPRSERSSRRGYPRGKPAVPSPPPGVRTPARRPTRRSGSLPPGPPSGDPPRKVPGRTGSSRRRTEGPSCSAGRPAANAASCSSGSGSRRSFERDGGEESAHEGASSGHSTRSTACWPVVHPDQTIGEPAARLDAAATRRPAPERGTPAFRARRSRPGPDACFRPPAWSRAGAGEPNPPAALPNAGRRQGPHRPSRRALLSHASWSRAADRTAAPARDASPEHRPLGPRCDGPLADGLSASSRGGEARQDLTFRTRPADSSLSDAGRGGRARVCRARLPRPRTPSVSPRRWGHNSASSRAPVAAATRLSRTRNGARLALAGSARSTRSARVNKRSQAAGDRHVATDTTAAASPGNPCQPLGIDDLHRGIPSARRALDASSSELMSSPRRPAWRASWPSIRTQPAARGTSISRAMRPRHPRGHGLASVPGGSRIPSRRSRRAGAWIPRSRDAGVRSSTAREPARTTPDCASSRHGVAPPRRSIPGLPSRGGTSQRAAGDPQCRDQRRERPIVVWNGQPPSNASLRPELEPSVMERPSTPRPSRD